MSREMLNFVLRELNASAAGIEASAVISNDGLALVSQFSADLDANRVGAIGAAMFSLAGRMSDTLGYGELEQLFIQGESGHMLLRRAGTHALLCVCAPSSARLDPVFQEARRAADVIGKIL